MLLDMLVFNHRELKIKKKKKKKNSWSKMTLNHWRISGEVPATELSGWQFDFPAEKFSLYLM
jgi:hypothetical protein